MKYNHGQKVTCAIKNVLIKDAAISIENGRVYICQDEKNGAECSNKLGYCYSWVLDDDVKFLKPKGTTMQAIKEYLNKYRDVFLTVGVVLVLDHFVFEGAFREKLKVIVDSFLEKRTKEIGDGK